MGWSGFSAALKNVYAPVTVGHIFCRKTFACAIRGHVMCFSSFVTSLRIVLGQHFIRRVK